MLNNDKLISAECVSVKAQSDSSFFNLVSLSEAKVFIMSSHAKSSLSHPLPSNFNPSKIAVDVALGIIKKYAEVEPNLSLQRAVTIVEVAVKKASFELFQQKQKVNWKKNENDYLNVEIDIAWVIRNSLVLGHIGTGRIYLLRQDSLDQLTTDHNYANSIFMDNLVPETEAQSRVYANKVSLTLGMEQSLEVETLKVELQDKDRILLCSFGIHHLKKDDEIRNIIRKSDSKKEGFNEALKELTHINRSSAAVLMEFSAQRRIAHTVPVVVPQTKMEAFKNNAFFNLLTFVERTRLLEISNTEKFADHHVFAREGDIPDKMWIVLNGKAIIKKGDHTIAECGFGEVIGESILIAQELRTADIVASENLKVIEFSKESLMHLIDGYMNNTAARIFRALSVFLFNKMNKITKQCSELLSENKRLKCENEKLREGIKKNENHHSVDS